MTAALAANETGRDRWQAVMAANADVELKLGPNTTTRYLLDPKRIGFMLARYKFAAKMLRECASVIDVGCGDGFGTVTFLQDTGASQVSGVDFDPELIRHAQENLTPAVCETRDDGLRLGFMCQDIFTEPYFGQLFHGSCCLDVIEHIEKSRAKEFVVCLASMLTHDGIAVVGTPNAHAAQYGSPQSQLGHINNYDADRLRAELKAQFRHVLMFSMNDEIVHTGFDRLAHYLIAVCVK